MRSRIVLSARVAIRTSSGPRSGKGLIRASGEKLSAALAKDRSGAVTALVDRLERAGYVERARDASDRRRVLVRPVRNSAREAEVMRLFEPMERAIGSTLRNYSDAERRLILDFIERSVDALQGAAKELRRSTPTKSGVVGGQSPRER